MTRALAIASTDPFQSDDLSAYALLTSAITATKANALATTGTGTIGNPWSGWEAALNALPAGSRIHFPAGYYTQTTRIDMQSRWVISGDGKDIAIITSSFTGTAFRFNLVFNPAIEHQAIRGVTIANTNGANIGSGIIATGSFASCIEDVKISGFRYGIAYINAEVFNTNRVSFEFQSRAGIWLVNNGDYNLTYADIDYSAFGGGGAAVATNVLSFNGCQINEGSGAVGVIDDGGTTHNFVGCNFNGCSSAIRLAGVTNLNMAACQFEGSALDVIITSNLTFNSSSGVGASGVLSFQECTVASLVAGKHWINATFANLILIGNEVITATTAITNPSALGSVIAINNRLNGGLIDNDPVYLFEIGSRDVSGNALTYARFAGGSLRIAKAGFGIEIKEGANARMGTGTLNGATPARAVIANTSITANTRVFLQRTSTVSATGALYERTDLRVPGTSFTVEATIAGDTSPFNYLLVEPSA